MDDRKDLTEPILSLNVDNNLTINASQVPLLSKPVVPSDVANKLPINPGQIPLLPKPVVPLAVDNKLALNATQDLASDSQEEEEEDSLRKITEFTMEALQRKKAMSAKPSSLWFLSFPIALLIWPLIRLIYSSYLNIGVVVAANSLIIFLCISLRVFPTTFCLYFYIVYFATVWIEFDVFRRQPRGEGFVKSIRETINYMETITPFVMFGKRWRMKFVVAMVIPLMMLVGCLLTSSFDISSLNNNNIQWTEDREVEFDSFCFTLRSFLDSDDLTGGFHSNPFLYSAACFSLLIIALLKGYEIGIFYRNIDFQLEETNKYVDSFIRSYDPPRIHEMCIYFKNRRESWIKRTKLFRIMDFNQTISLLVPIFTLCLLVFLGDGEHFYAGSLNRFLPSDLNIEVFNLNIVVQVYFCMLMYIWKLRRCLTVSTHADVVNTRLTNINQELLFLKDFPSLFIQTKKNGMVFTPAPNEIVSWSDIVIKKEVNKDLLETDDSLAEILVKILEKNEGAKELTFKDITDLLRRDTKIAITAFNQLKSEYEKLFSVVEYKLMGLFRLNRKTVNTVIAGLATTSVTFLVRYISQSVADKNAKHNAD